MKFVKIIFIFFPAVVLILSFRCVTHFNVQNFTGQASVLTTYGTSYLPLLFTLASLLSTFFYQRNVSLIFDDMAIDKLTLNSILTEQNIIESKFLNRNVRIDAYLPVN